MGYGKNIEPLMKILTSASYFRFGLAGITESLFNDRGYLNCDDDYDYCHYRDPNLVLEEMGMGGSTPGYQCIFILIYCFVFRILAFFALKYRMTSGLRNKIVDLVAKTVKKTK